MKNKTKAKRSFGLRKSRHIDGVEYQERLRREWEGLVEGSDIAATDEFWREVRRDAGEILAKQKRSRASGSEC